MQSCNWIPDRCEKRKSFCPLFNKQYLFFFAVRFTLHHHFLQCLFCRKQDIHLHRIYGRWVSVQHFSLQAFDCVENSLNHWASIYTLQTRESLISVNCLACLCAKSYMGVTFLDWSAFVGVFVRVGLNWCEMSDCMFLGMWACLFKCVLMQQFPCFTNVLLCQHSSLITVFSYFIKLFFPVYTITGN